MGCLTMVVKRNLIAAAAVLVSLGAGYGIATAQEASPAPAPSDSATQSLPSGTAAPSAGVAAANQPTYPGATPSAIQTIPGMPPVVNPTNLYSETTAGHIAPEIAQDPARVYVPNLRSNDVYVIDRKSVV